MTPIRSKFSRVCASRLAVLVAVLMLASLAGATSAEADIEGTITGHLPGKTWTTNGAYGYIPFMWGEASLSFCVTAAEYSGSWSFPYGWHCNPGVEDPYFAEVEGYPAVDNPNSREISFSVGYGY